MSDAYWAVYSINNPGSLSCSSSSSGPNRPDSSQCWREERPGVKYYNNVVRDVRTASDLEQCSELCHQAHYCRSFSFKSVHFYLTVTVLTTMT